MTGKLKEGARRVGAFNLGIIVGAIAMALWMGLVVWAFDGLSEQQASRLLSRQLNALVERVR